MSNIDFACDLFLGKNNRESYTASKDRFKFPNNDDQISDYKDERSDAEKFSDIIHIINSKISPEMKELWDQICQLDVASPCFYKSGLEFGSSQMRQLANDYKVKMSEDLDPLTNMPESLKNANHAPSCPSKGKPWNFNDPCSYNSMATDPKVGNPTEAACQNPESPQGRNNPEECINAIEILLEDYKKNSKTFAAKETALSALEWIKLNSKKPDKCNTMLRLLETNSRLNKRKMKFIAEKLKDIKEKLKEKNGASVKEIYVANTEQQQRLPFLLGLINHSNKKAKNLDKSKSIKFLADSGSDLSLLSYSKFIEMGFKETRLIPTPNYTLRGSTGAVHDSFIGKFNTSLHLLDKNDKMQKFKICFYVIHPKAQLEVCILGNPFFSKYFHSSIHFRENGNMEVHIKKRSHSEKLIFPANNLSQKDNGNEAPDPDTVKLCNSTSATSHKQSTEIPILQQNSINSSTNNNILYDIYSQKYERDKEPTEKQINDDIQKQIYSEYLGVQDNMQKEEIFSFLSNSIQSEETGGDIEAILEKHLLDKISIDTTNTEENEIDKKLFSHLKKEDADKVKELIQKYDKFWAKSSYSLGEFVGFKVRLDTLPGMKAVQKQRRQSLVQEESVSETIENFTEAGLFEEATSHHDDFIANLNIVPKIQDSSEIRFLSKADKHINKFNTNKNEHSATGWRCAFDFTTLNNILPDKGKLSLPSIAQVQTKVRNCYVSSIDLKNQFFSLLLEPESKAKTNFYFKTKILRHTRLPMGTSLSPYLASLAMQWTFSKKVLEKFLRERNINPETFQHKSFESFCVWYLDDILIYSNRNSTCPELNLNNKEMHLLLLDAVLFAVSEAGWIGSKKKLKVLSTKFAFLGEEINTEENQSKMQDIRVQSILKWRSPRSAAEAGSRMSILSYYSRFAPYLRLLALPIFHAIKQKKFQWGKLQEEAFRNVLFVIALQIKMANFDPEQILLITTDSSAVAMSGAFFNFCPKTGELELIDSITKIFAGAQLRQSPVQKETLALMYSLVYGENYIRSNQVQTWIFSDANSLQYIQRNKMFNSKQFNNSIFISSLPRTSFFYVSGRSLLLADALTRQFQSVFTGNYEVSRELCEMIPPIQTLKIKHLAAMDSSQLRSFILSYPTKEILDCWQKQYFYTQDLTKNQLQDYRQNISNEKQLITTLSLGWNNPKLINLPIWTDLLKSKKVSESEIKAILKNTGMAKLHQEIQNLNLDKETLENDLNKFHLVHTPTKVQTKSSSYKTEVNRQCSCQECRNLSGKLSLDPITMQMLKGQSKTLENFIAGSKKLLNNILNANIEVYFDTLKQMSCNAAKSTITLGVFDQIIKELSKHHLTMSSKKIHIIPFSASKEYTVVLQGNSIIVKTNTKATVAPLDSISFKCQLILGTWLQASSLQYDEENLMLLQFPEHQGFIKKFEQCTFFNLKNVAHEFEANSTIFTIELDGQDKREGLVLVRTDPKVLEEHITNLNNSHLNNTLQNLSEIVGKVVSYHSKIEAKIKETTNEKKEIEEKRRALDIKEEIAGSYTTIAQKLNKLLIGQKLFKTQNLFDKETIAALQNDCDFCKDLINKLKEDKNCTKQFQLVGGVLYRTSTIFGKEALNLVIPNHLCREILKNLHNKFNIHGANNQLCKLYQINFYTPNLNKIAKSIKNDCVICTLCKRNYKHKAVGLERKFENNENPGKHLIADVIYLNQDNLGYKYCLLLVDRLTSYTTAYPMKKLDSASCAAGLKSYLHTLPPPLTLSCDGDGSFSSSFQKVCEQNDILLKTNIPRNSNTVGTAEIAIKQFRNIAIQAAHKITKGRNNWSVLLPIILKAFNNKAAYNQLVPRVNLFLSPFFETDLGFLLATPEMFEINNEKHGSNALDIVQSTYRKLNNKRKKELENLRSKFGKGPGFKLKPGQIVTESPSKEEKEKMGTSAGLTPGPQKLFKVLEVCANGHAAFCINLKTGQKLTHSINNLAPLTIEDSLANVDLTNIHPEHSFQDLFSHSRLKNLYGFQPNKPSEEEQNIVEEVDDTRATRSGTIYHSNSNQTNSKSILKNTIECLPDLEKIDQAQLEAIKRAVTVSKHAQIPLTPNQIQARNYRQQYNLNKCTPNSPKIKTKRRISFGPRVLNFTLNKNYDLKDEQKTVHVNFSNQELLFLVHHPMCLSIKELSCLQR